MHKFLYCLVGSFFLMIGIFVVGGMLQANAPLRVYEDPVLTQTRACYQKHERVVQPTTEADKGDLWWWCVRRSVQP